MHIEAEAIIYNRYQKNQELTMKDFENLKSCNCLIKTNTCYKKYGFYVSDRPDKREYSPCGAIFFFKDGELVWSVIFPKNTHITFEAQYIMPRYDTVYYTPNVTIKNWDKYEKTKEVLSFIVPLILTFVLIWSLADVGKANLNLFSEICIFISALITIAAIWIIFDKKHYKLYKIPDVEKINDEYINYGKRENAVIEYLRRKEDNALTEMEKAEVERIYNLKEKN